MAEPFVCPCWEHVERHDWRVICGRPGCARGWAKRQRENANAQLVLDTFSPEIVDVQDAKGRL